MNGLTVWNFGMYSSFIFMTSDFSYAGSSVEFHLERIRAQNNLLGESCTSCRWNPWVGFDWMDGIARG